MKKEDPFETALTVRGYEMDAFGHVNNAVYVQYFEHCRWMAFQEMGDAWLEGGYLSVVVRKLEVEYEAPARVFDELRGRVWVESVGRTSVTFGQELVKGDDDQVIARGKVIAVCIDADGKPHPLPERWQEFDD